MSKEIDDLFNARIDAIKANENGNGNYKGALVLGVYGVGGSGKSTLCQTMVHFYAKGGLHGLSWCLELPTYENLEQRLEKLKIALKELTLLSKEYIEEIHSCSEAIVVLVEKIKGKKIFWAIDNLWDWSKEYVHRIINSILDQDLQNINDLSKVIVTSRSEDVLWSLWSLWSPQLKKDHNFVLVAIPSLKQDEALGAILTRVGIIGGNLNNEAISEKLKNIVKLCSYKGSCHPLLLSAIIGKLNKVSPRGASELDKALDKALDKCIKELEGSYFSSQEFEDKVLKVLSSSYDQLEEDLKIIFLDVVILWESWFRRLDKTNLCETMRMLYENYDKDTMEEKLEDLQRSGMLTLVDNGEYMDVNIHDMYVELGKRKAWEKNIYFFNDKSHLAKGLQDSTNINIENMQLARRLVYHRKHRDDLDDLDFDFDCHGNPKACGDQDFAWFMDVFRKCVSFDKLEYLEVKKAEVTTLRVQVYVDELGNMKMRSDKELYDLLLEVDYPKSRFRRLRILRVWDCAGIRKINVRGVAPNLVCLHLHGCRDLEEINGLTYLNRLQDLEINTVFNQMLTLNLGGCRELRRFQLNGLEKLQRLAELQLPRTLEKLDLSGNRSLKDLGGISSLVSLQQINLHGCDSVIVFPKASLRKLTKLNMSKCYKLKEVMPGTASLYDVLPSLEELHLEYAGTIEELAGF